MNSIDAWENSSKMQMNLHTKIWNFMTLDINSLWSALFANGLRDFAKWKKRRNEKISLSFQSLPIEFENLFDAEPNSN